MEKNNVYYQLMLVLLYLLSMIQDYTFQLLLFQKKIIEQQNKGFQRSIYWKNIKQKK